MNEMKGTDQRLWGGELKFREEAGENSWREWQLNFGTRTHVGEKGGLFSLSRSKGRRGGVGDR